ncbi:MAG: rRNA maturation RNase YbeY [bacterium]|nr:rRNA maturation RNase YbeY [bacterium]
MGIRVTWDVDTRPIEAEAVVAAVTEALAHGGRASIDVDVILVDDPTLTDLHARFLGDPTPTDVISFELGEDGPGPAAELYVSVDCASRVAAERGVGAARELALYLVHGTLHLCGYDDHEAREREAMRAAEQAVLTKLGYPRDDAPHDRE